MYGLSIGHLVVVVAIVILLFGRGRITALMADIGGGFRELKRAGRELTETKETLQDEARQLTSSVKEEVRKMERTL